MPADTVNVTDEPVQIVPDHVTKVTAHVVNEGAVAVTVGSDDVTFGDGMDVDAGDARDFDLDPGETLWAVAADGTAADVDVSW